MKVRPSSTTRTKTPAVATRAQTSAVATSAATRAKPYANTHTDEEYEATQR